MSVLFPELEHSSMFQVQTTECAEQDSVHISPSAAVASSAAGVNESRRRLFAMDQQFNLFLHIECSYNSLVCSSDGFYRRILHVLSTYFANLFVIPVSLVCKLSS